MTTGLAAPELKAEDYENDDLHLEELQALAQRLEADLPDEKLDTKAIARFQMGLLQFMETALGPNSMPPRPFPKLPFTLVDDPAPTGSLYDIIMKSHQLKEASNMSLLDWANPQRRMQLLNMLETVRATLTKSGYFISPVVYFDPSVPATDQQELAAMVESLKGKVVSDSNAVGLTHVVFPFGADGDPDDGHEYMRVQRKRGGKALVHRWYSPDSHNEWLDASIAPENTENDAEHVLKGPAKVFVRWVRDSKKFNEWMNIVDYETDEGNEEHERYKEELAARGLTPADLLARKRKATRPGGGAVTKVQVAEAVTDVDPNFKEEIAEGVVRRHVRTTSKKLLDGTANSENLSHGQLPKLYDGSDVRTALRAVQPVQPSQPLTTPVATFTIPQYSHWFRLGRVHEIEVQANVEFFNHSSTAKTEGLYIEYRDFIVREYRREPGRRLAFMDCRKFLVGDVNAIYRIWSFLDSWGLINFEALSGQAADDSVQTVTVDAAGNLLAAKMRNVRPAAGALQAPQVASMWNMPKANVATGVMAALATGDPWTRGAPPTDAAAVARQQAAARAVSGPTSTQADVYCNVMPWVRCTDCRYHCMRFPDVDLCPQAFAEGRFPPGTCAKDFVKIDRSTNLPADAGWSPHETLLLLEGLELYGERWGRVAEHVGTKSRLDCVLHFTQLPVEEVFVAELERGRERQSGQENEDGRAQQQPDYPFATSTNAVMSQLAFLAEVVGPQVASAAASAALQELASAGSVVPEGGTDTSAPAHANGQPGSSEPAAPEAPTNLADAVPPARMQAAAAAALSGAAVKARLLAEAEETRMSSLAMAAIEALTEKLRLKFKYLTDIEGEMQVAHKRLVHARQAALQERNALAQQRAQLQQQRQALEQLLQQSVCGGGAGGGASQAQSVHTAEAVAAPQPQVPAAAQSLEAMVASVPVGRPVPGAAAHPASSVHSMDNRAASTQPGTTAAPAAAPSTLQSTAQQGVGVLYPGMGARGPPGGPQSR